MTRVISWLRSAEAWLDRWGFPAWIAAIVIAFVVAWPIGLAVLGYMIWSGRMGRMGCKGWRRDARTAAQSTGNSAFDEYREETLRRLEDEREAFSGFLDRLRRAKDRAEFDQFMTERRDRPVRDSGEPA